MKIKYATLILIVFLFGSCTEKQIVNAPFNPSLEQVITELVDSLGYEIAENKLLSIQFLEYKGYEPGWKMKIFISEWYASGSIEGYTKIGNTTVAIYNIKNDYYELVNKNAITFFTDTLVGFRDVCVWETSERTTIIPQFYYVIYSGDSISMISSEKRTNCEPYADLIRRHRCKGGIVFTIPEEYWFHHDSIEAEEGLECYKKKVEHFRNKKGTATNAVKQKKRIEYLD